MMSIDETLAQSRRHRLHRFGRMLESIWRTEAVFPGIWRGLAIVVAGLFTVYQLHDAQAKRDIERTLSYVERYESGSLLEARKALNTLIGVETASLGENVSFETKFDSTMSMIYEDKIKVSRNIDDVVDFFEGLDICLEEKLCSKSVTERYFKGDAEEFYCNWYIYIELQTYENARYGNGIRSIAKNCLSVEGQFTVDQMRTKIVAREKKLREAAVL